MGIKKSELFVDFEYNFKLIGIVSTEKFYRLVWFINQINDFNFIKHADYALPASQGEALFEQFIFADEENHTQYFLIANKDDANQLLPELRNFDYLMLITGSIEYLDENHLKNKLQQIQVIQLAYCLDTDELKNKENLIYLQ